ncbi:MAG: hypothetical protein QXR34_09425 [Saccharolobus sp.]|uniref:hypothetical protein n=1 Tax=Thermoprotei TaxID=183924 RepID=UPI00315F070E
MKGKTTKLIIEILSFSIYLYTFSVVLSIALNSLFPNYFIAILAYLLALFLFSSVTKNRRNVIKNTVSNAIKNPYLISKGHYKALLFILYPFIQYIIFSFLIFIEFMIFYPIYHNYLAWAYLPDSKGVYLNLSIYLNQKEIGGIELNLYYLLYPIISFLEIEYWAFIIGQEYGYTVSIIYFALIQTFGSINIYVAIYQFFMNLFYFYTNIIFIKYISKNIFILLLPSIIVLIIFGIKIH